MKIESYEMMKITFEYYKCDLFKSMFNNKQNFIIYFNEHFNTISAGWLLSNQLNECKAIYIILNTDEYENFNEKIYNEKVNLLTKKLKEYYVNKKLQDIDGDFV